MKTYETFTQPQLTHFYCISANDMIYFTKDKYYRIRTDRPFRINNKKLEFYINNDKNIPTKIYKTLGVPNSNIHNHILARKIIRGNTDVIISDDDVFSVYSNGDITALFVDNLDVELFLFRKDVMKYNL